MNEKPSTSSHPRRAPTRQRGLTLVEVIAGLALLSTLLVAVLTTKARMTRQWAHAHRKVAAVAAADTLLTKWWQDLEHFPRRSAGRVPGGAGLAWRTRPVAEPLVNAMMASVIRVEILDERAPGAVLAAVEVVLDDDRPLNVGPADALASREAP